MKIPATNILKQDGRVYVALEFVQAHCSWFRSALFYKTGTLNRDPKSHTGRFQRGNAGRPVLEL